MKRSVVWDRRKCFAILCLRWSTSRKQSLQQAVICRQLNARCVDSKEAAAGSQQSLRVHPAARVTACSLPKASKLNFGLPVLKAANNLDSSLTTTPSLVHALTIAAARHCLTARHSQRPPNLCTLCAVNFAQQAPQHP